MPGEVLVVLDEGEFTEPEAPAPVVEEPDVARPRVRLDPRAPVDPVVLEPAVVEPDMPGSLRLDPDVIPVEPEAPELMPG